LIRALVLACMLVLLLGCRRDERATPPAPASSAAGTTPVAVAPRGDPEHGKALFAQFECNRCHTGPDLDDTPLDKHCVRCHQQIHAGTYRASATTLAKWQKTIVHFRDVPSLTSVGERLQGEWISRFLLNPVDLRPHLETTMPRLALSPDEARDIAAYLTKNAPAAPTVSLEGASAAKGWEVFDAKGCRQCHQFTGAPAARVEPLVKTDPHTPAAALAPDLRWARERVGAAELVRWISDPQAVKPGTLMPKLDLTADEVKNLAAFILQSELAPPPQEPVPQRLPVLVRRVSYDEVSRRVFRNTCWHCHAEPDYAIGDGGPGNTGGFGFKPRGLNLAEYDGVNAGYIDDKGERRSIFSAMSDGTPRLVAALVARQREEAGQSDPALRGMPLGLPAVSAEDVQLVESWIAQGRPQ
jgi:cytochrome c1